MKRLLPVILLAFAFVLGALVGPKVGPALERLEAKAFAQSTSAKANHISNVRAAYQKIIDADSALDTLLKESTDNAYTFVDADFTGANAGITAANYNTALTQATNWHNAIGLGVNVGGGSSTTLPSGLRGVFNKIAK
jgi:hypothetical protein